MADNTISVSLSDIIATYFIQKGLPFRVGEQNQVLGGVVYNLNNRCRALIWESGPPKLYNTTKLAPCITIYNIDPEKGYTAIGDRRCDLSIASPNFFEQLEYHLLHENE